MTEQPISQLFSEINELQKTILYLEGRILRKRIAIAELLEARECLGVRPDQTIKPCASESPTTPAPRLSLLSVRKMVEAVLPYMNGSTFWYADLKQACSEKFPGSQNRLTKGIHRACSQLLSAGRIKRVPGGFERVDSASK